MTMDAVSGSTLALLAAFYLAYLGKQAAQRRRGIAANVMIKGRKSPRAHRVGVLLTAATYAACAVQFVSCLWDGAPGAVRLPAPLRWLGVGLTALGDGLFIAAFCTLKDSWRAGIDEGQKTELVTGGVYRFSRNPAFVGFDLAYLGCTLAVCNGLMLAAAAFAAGMIHLQILEEEKHLEKMFGQPYREYRRRTRRYL